MIRTTEKQRDILQEKAMGMVPFLSGDLTSFLDAFDAYILEHGFDKDYEITDEGSLLQRLLDDILFLNTEDGYMPVFE